MLTRRSALLALVGTTAGLAVGCGGSDEGQMTPVREEANRKGTEAMEAYAKEQAAKKKKK